MLLSSFCDRLLKLRKNRSRIITPASYPLLSRRPQSAIACWLEHHAVYQSSLKWARRAGCVSLEGPPESMDHGISKPEAKLYVGQADSVADGPDSRLKSEKKKWWRTAVVFRRADKNPLNLSQCKFLESRLCRMQLLSLGLPQGVFRPSHAGASDEEPCRASRPRGPRPILERTRESWQESQPRQP
jgi:hypothetical protein